jgi:hypothetical protein
MAAGGCVGRASNDQMMAAEIKIKTHNNGLLYGITYCLRSATNSKSPSKSTASAKKPYAIPLFKYVYMAKTTK